MTIETVDSRPLERESTESLDVARIIGTWELVSMFSERPDGSRVEPFGGAPMGSLVYTRDGFVSVQIGSRRPQKVGASLSDLLVFKRLRRAPWLLFKALRLLPAMFRFLLTGTRYLAYAGRFSISDGCIHHQVETSLFPDWVGTRLKREVTLDATGQLTLVARGSIESQRMVWRRMLLRDATATS